MTIYEPCDYVSNLAYYHSATKICDYGEHWSVDQSIQRTLKRLFAALGSMSAFMHGSYTLVGGDYDNQNIALIAAVGHAIQLQSLHSNSTILNYLSKTPRNQTIYEIVDMVAETYYSKPVREWKSVIDAAPYEHTYQNTFGAIIANIANLILPPWACTPFMTFFADHLLNAE